MDLLFLIMFLFFYYNLGSKIILVLPTPLGKQH